MVWRGKTAGLTAMAATALLLAGCAAIPKAAAPPPAPAPQPPAATPPPPVSDGATLPLVLLPQAASDATRTADPTTASARFKVEIDTDHLS